MGIEYRGADGQFDRLPALAAELVRRQVAVIAAGNLASALAAKAATTTIPIVFAVGEDPVMFGLVANLARPGGSLTGINFLNVDVTKKRLGLLRELVPAASRVAVLVNPTNGPVTELTSQEVAEAARALGLRLQVFNASSNREIDAAFAAIARERPDGLFVGGDALFTGRKVQLATAAARRSCDLLTACIYRGRRADELRRQRSGCLPSGRNLHRTHSQGRQAGRPASCAGDEFELVINAQTARTLGLTVPPSLLALADEVIE